ncbi:hypothetical protein CO230_00835 [Chryseobacterium sp. 6424]|uniref:DUF2683 family protein n=1 Tax=Chryseobacterium sp. 6424 TaxID=2039166 RepID=UPI000EFD47F6|nr:DUF2683 family protein [Chryseobacterium sp. 6424]AYO56811.1 hypothetical protein CO230_00835 [Chryseobacterium sp. 6424]
MESLIVHPKNQMELNALKSVMKDMGIRYEKFHTRNTKSQSSAPRTAPKTPKNHKDKPKNEQ